MSALAEAVTRARTRIRQELEPAFRQLFVTNPKADLLLDTWVDALVERIRVADHGDLRRLLADMTVSTEFLAVLLLRMASAVRHAAMNHMQSREAGLMASAGIDRAVAETIDELARTPRQTQTPAAERPAPPPAFPTSDELNDPSIIRNIREVLGDTDGPTDRRRGSVLVCTPGEAGNDRSEHGTALMLVEYAAAMEAGGGSIVLQRKDLVAGFWPTSVAHNDVTDAIATALTLWRQVGKPTRMGICRGMLTLRSDPAAGAQTPEPDTVHGTSLWRAIGLAHLARRPGIYCGEEVQQQVGNLFVLRADADTHQNFQLDTNQPRWMDRWEHAALVQPSSWSGDASDTDALSAWLTDDSPVSAIGLRARLGGGKQRLLHAGLTAAKIADDRVVASEPYPDTPIPYWPLVVLAHQLLAVPWGPLSGSLLRQKLDDLAEGAPAAENSPLLPVLATLLGVEQDTDTTPPAEPGGELDKGKTEETQETQKREDPETDDNVHEELDLRDLRGEIGNAFRLLVEAAANQEPNQPLVLVVRETQHLDEPTAHVLQHMVQHYGGKAPLRLVLTYTQQPPMALKNTDTPFREIRLRRLEPQACLAIARAMLEQERLPAELEEVILSRADGSPMMTSFAVRYLVEAGHMRREKGEWCISRGNSTVTGTIRVFDVPRRLTELVRRRIGELPGDLAAILKSLSVVGNELASSLVEMVWVGHGQSRDQLHSSLVLLSEMGFLREELGGWRFAHAAVRQVAYQQLSDSERRRYHRLTLAALQEVYPDSATRVPGLIFHHAMGAGDTSQAEVAGLRAARRAFALHDHRQTLRLVCDTLAVNGERRQQHREETEQGDEPASSQAQLGRTRFELLSLREQIHAARGKVAEQEEDLNAALLVALELEDSSAQGRTLHRLARLKLMRGTADQAAELAERSLTLLHEETPIDRSNALRTYALALWRLRRPQEAGQALHEALTLYENQGHRRGMGFVLHNLGMFALDSGAHEQAADYLQLSLEIKEETQDQRGRAALLEALGQVALLSRRQADAISHLQHAIEVRRSIGENLASACIALGEALLDDDPAEAEKLARQAAKEIRRRHLKRLGVQSDLLLSQALLRQNNREGAGRTAARAQKKATAANAGLLEVRAQVVRAEVDLAYPSRRRGEQALRRAQAAAAQAKSLGAMRWYLEAQSLVVLAFARLDTEQASALGRDLQEALDERDYPGLDVGLVRARLRQSAPT